MSRKVKVKKGVRGFATSEVTVTFLGEEILSVMIETVRVGVLEWAYFL